MKRVVMGRKFYIPHTAVERENAETTKMSIVYDASARESPSAASLNECLEVGPPLQKQILSGGNRGRLKASILANSVSWSRPGCLALPLVKRSKEQTSGNIAFHQSTLWLSVVSVPSSRIYQRTFITIQISKPKTG